MGLISRHYENYESQMFPNRRKPHCNGLLIHNDLVRLLEGQSYDGAVRTISPHAVTG